MCDNSVSVIVLVSDAALHDWDACMPVGAPQRQRRSANLTITGAQSDRARWPVLDLGFVSDKMLLDPGVTMLFSRVVLTRWQSEGPGFQPDCVPPSPTAVPLGTPAGASLVTTCYASALLAADVILYSAALGPYDKHTLAGYWLEFLDTEIKCETVLDSECVARLGSLGCFYSLFPRTANTSVPVVPAAAGALPRTPGTLVAGTSAQQAPAAGGGGGGGSSDATLGAVLGCVLGGLAALCLLAALAWVLILRRRGGEAAGSKHGLLQRSKNTSASSSQMLTTADDTSGPTDPPRMALRVPPGSSSRLKADEVITPSTAMIPGIGVVAGIKLQRTAPEGPGRRQAGNTSARTSRSGRAYDSAEAAAEAESQHGPAESGVVTLLPQVLGKGTFGRVQQGLWGGRRVAVKLLNLGLLSPELASAAWDPQAAAPPLVEGAAAAARPAVEAAARQIPVAERHLAAARPPAEPPRDSSMGSSSRLMLPPEGDGSSTSCTAAGPAAPPAHQPAAFLFDATPPELWRRGAGEEWDGGSLLRAHEPPAAVRLPPPPGCSQQPTEACAGHTTPALALPTLARLTASSVPERPCLSVQQQAAGAKPEAQTEPSQRPSLPPLTGSLCLREAPSLAPPALGPALQHGAAIPNDPYSTVVPEPHTEPATATCHKSSSPAEPVPPANQPPPAARPALLGGVPVGDKASADGTQDQGGGTLTSDAMFPSADMIHCIVESQSPFQSYGAAGGRHPLPLPVPPTRGAAAVPVRQAAAMDAGLPAPPRAEPQGSNEAAAGRETASALCRSFRAEVEVMARMSHPNIAPPHVLVLELMDTSLGRLLYGSGPRGGEPRELLPLPTVVHIALQVAQALSYMHPTAAYMSPETLSPYNHTVTHHVDIYALGVILWEMLAGQPPWQGLTLLQMAVEVGVKGRRPPLQGLQRERCPERIIMLLKSCWEEDPLRRPAASEVAKHLLLVQEDLRQGKPKFLGPLVLQHM
ncbi:hypothetical protein HYH03_003424 [Edaphochlamys debaryana]|uniref:Protein kinase domain-containing protein n=1 Tax=Edaphochlamys debaryana TaxID=47281 RepID=A0A835YHB8_9CHLO|nr:hypothetical protein HYH03_003424 [Edaphochlamys debaryana]|eukprot:KAG2498680.1 hypothetical protein HYH03_003424 [Edaphochlamys debaryana]